MIAQKIKNTEERNILYSFSYAFFHPIYILCTKFEVIAIEQADNSVDYKKVKTKGNTAFILGNEPNGIEKEILDICDIIAEIPMRGEKESLNVSVAAGIVLFRILDI